MTGRVCASPAGLFRRQFDQSGITHASPSVSLGRRLLQPIGPTFDAEDGTLIDEIVPPSAELAFPVSVAIGPQGDIYATSTGIVFAPPPPKIMGVLRFRGTNGAFAGVVAPHGVNGLAGPSDLKFGPDGHLYVGAGFVYWFGIFPGSILRYNGATGTFIDAFVPKGSGGLGIPMAFAFGPDGNLYVCNQKQEGPDPDNRLGEVLRFNGATGAFIDVFVPAESGSFYAGIAFGPDGNLYVSNPSTHRILRFDGTTGAFIDVFISNATSPLTDPRGMIFGANGTLYICNAAAGTVLRYNSTTGGYLHTFTPPKASVPRGPFNLTLTEMDLPWPEWQYVPRPPWATAIGVNLWLIAIGAILGALAVLLFRIWPKPWPTR